MSTTHLLDTNIVSHLMRSKPTPAIIDRLQALGPEHVAISVITALELRQGAELSSHAGAYHTLIDTILASLPVLTFPLEAAAIGGRMRATLQQSGRSLADMDSLIAVHALTESLVLVSNDKAFKQVPDLQVENWLETQ